MPEPLLKVLQQMKLSPKELLEPDPTVEFHADTHRYFDLKRKHYVRDSVTEISQKGDFLTQVMNRPDGDEMKGKIEESIRRGVTVHDAVEHWFKSEKKEVKDTGDYRAWVNNFVSYPNLEGWDCVASEYRMINRTHDYAGTLDFLLEHKDVGLVLCDLKTKNVKFSKNHAQVMTQLGGYISLLYHVLPTLDIAKCRVYWLTPEKCSTDEYNTVDCLDLFSRARQIYKQSQPTF